MFGLRLFGAPSVVALFLLMVVGSGCTRPLGSWFDSNPDAAVVPPDASPCATGPDFYCARREDGPCSRWVTVSPECSPLGVWQCPAESKVLGETSDPVESCLPLYGEHSPFVWLASTGTPVARGDGRCMWILSDGVTAGDEHLSHPAVLLPSAPSSGDCLPGAEVLGGEAPFSVADETDLGEVDIASLGDGFRWGGRTWIYYRHWVWDANQVFGVRLLGTRLAWYHHETESVRFLDGFLWEPELAFGDAAVVADGVPYVFGCHGPPTFLSYECHVARLTGTDIGDPASYEHFAGDGEWSSDIAEEVPVFESGPHRTAVRFHPGLDSYILLFAHGFGTQIEMRLAPSPEGPWTAPVVVADCELPASDPDAFCATPALHLELMNDWRPEQLAVTYDIGTLAPDAEARRAAAPAAYWPRLVRFELP